MATPANSAVELLSRLRSRKPLIHHITNMVVMNETANITLCAGALPVMAHAPEEVAEMASAAGALVLNIGTLTREQVEAMLIAGHAANAKGIPIVLDPVGAGATRLRTDSALVLLEELKIAIVRGNLAEVAVLAGYEAKISGVESMGVDADTETVAKKMVERFDCVTAITGRVDVISDRRRLARVSNGHAMMSTVTGTGCMATTVVACYAAIEPDFFVAATSALAVYGLAGEIAATHAKGPGTFHVELYDALAGLTEGAVNEGARIEVQSA
jgi:hydroxyethylthiazole kinase